MALKSEIKLEQQPRVDSFTNRLDSQIKLQAIKMALELIKNTNNQKSILYIDSLSNLVALKGETKYSSI